MIDWIPSNHWDSKRTTNSAGCYFSNNSRINLAFNNISDPKMIRGKPIILADWKVYFFQRLFDPINYFFVGFFLSRKSDGERKRKIYINAFIVQNKQSLVTTSDSHEENATHSCAFPYFTYNIIKMNFDAIGFQICFFSIFSNAIHAIRCAV